ncbi:dynamin family protein [Acidiferrobacter sp.]|uniref:dynamin family protein n=1 Tax=Acidiferrobacter sp. TaxID=1872107 RepID=UPI002619E211|nr:dynamin family protein [Acidiferrobacter sp.]
MSQTAIEQRFEAYGLWRRDLAQALTELRTWLAERGLSQPQSDLHLDRMHNVLRDDKLYLAFVAEFSRGKSELINALFFGEQGQRILPSSAGRTTMCPTELFYEPDRPASIRLLPIETRRNGATVAEFKGFPDEWETITLNVDDAPGTAEALRHIADVKRVPAEEAQALGLTVTRDIAETGAAIDAEGEVEIPRWRYALINFPHPLLSEGLVILDTPGLNALGAEPELTLNTLPNAHAILFVLAADTGVTQSEIAVWRDHVASSHKGRLVVLNKVDGLWDELRNADDVAREIARQVSETARYLGVTEKRVYPVSAQKALAAKIRGDHDLETRSGIGTLERALADELLPGKGGLVAQTVAHEFGEVEAAVERLIVQRLQGVREHWGELSALNGKNMDVIEHMMGKVRADKTEFDRSMQRFHATRTIFAQQSAALYARISLRQLDALIQETKKNMETCLTTAGLKTAMQAFFGYARTHMEEVVKDSQEIKTLMDGVYRKFQEEHGLANIKPATFSVMRYTREIKRLQEKHEQFMRGLSLIMTEQRAVVRGFFESAISKVRAIYVSANRDADDWLRDMMAPMESQVREHQAQLRRRLESIKRIHQASDTLEGRMAELKQVLEEISEQHRAAHTTFRQIRAQLNAAP